jgi:hypothetical protein
MAAAEGTGRAGRPPLIGNRVPLRALHEVLGLQIPTLYISMRQRDASANRVSGVVMVFAYDMLRTVMSMGKQTLSAIK